MGRVQLLAAALLGAGLSGAAGAATIAYNIIDLGTFGTAANVRSYGHAVNNFGQVTGFSDTGTTNRGATHAFLWANNTLQDLGTLATGTIAVGYGINNKGQVTGYSNVSGNFQHAFLWQNGTMTDLGTNGGVHAQGRDINDAGKMVGFSIFSGSRNVGWANENGFESLQMLGTGNQSNAYRVNSAGVAAGYATNPLVYGVRRAVTWDANGVVTNLNIGNGNDSIAYGLNDGGDVVGRYLTINGNNDTIARAFWWHKATGTYQTLGGLPGEVNYYAYGISNDGKIVGIADHANAFGNSAIISGVIWQNGIATKLNDLIDPLLGWNVQFAQDISQNGFYITGQGTIAGRQHAFLMCAVGQPCNGVIPGLDPPPPPPPPPIGGVPEPGTWELLAAGFGLMGLVQRRRGSAPATAA
ncbi:HAF repeat-containing PEP-CTERM protein [Sandarakinorhabdus oryzae]|uniref:HAF repeat-containing PEP-CTERM protein n=1 Tax=Sandarakinorhabdus oryzae TaxID=2675220 RepID=UPI0012E26FEA|nr:HAF repeat-containing PEP-CTERM protein [Sandarakinorhabdus oryzae]